MKIDFKEIVEQAGIPTTEEGWQAVFRAEVDAQGGLINNDSPFSAFWKLIAAIVSKPAAWLVNNLLIERILPNMFLQTATDDAFIESKAWEHEIERKPAFKTRGRLRFYRAASKGSALLIPQGTVVQTDPINGVVYRVVTIADAVLVEDAQTIDVAVEAEHAGAAYNLGAGYYHILPKAVTGIDAVTNETLWIDELGADSEPNEELKERIRNAFTAAAGWHIDAVYSRMLTERGGLDTDNLFFEHEAPRGAGTANVYILPDTGQASPELIADLNNHIMKSGFHGHGDDVLVSAMPDINHDLAVTVYLLPNILETEVAAILTGVEDFIRCAFRENSNYNATRTKPADRFSFSKLGQELHAEFPGIDSLQWHQLDIISAMNVPRIGTLTVSRGE